MEFTISSKALYSTWVYYKPNRILFDIGEGVSTILGNKVYGVENVFLTHAHVDHISGLWGFINTRNNAMGSREKDLNIYYPASKQIIDYVDFIKSANKRLRYNLKFHELSLSESIEIDKNKYVKPFKTRHTPGDVSYGYQILEIRKRLKEDFKDLKQEEIKNLIEQQGRDYVTEEYHANVLTLSGDSLPIPPEFAMHCDNLLHECTFFFENDRKLRNHTSLSEIKELITETKPKRLILYHISSRYNRFVRKVEAKLRDEFKDIDISIVHPEELFEI